MATPAPLAPSPAQARFGGGLPGLLAVLVAALAAFAAVACVPWIRRVPDAIRPHGAAPPVPLVPGEDR